MSAADWMQAALAVLAWVLVLLLAIGGRDD